MWWLLGVNTLRTMQSAINAEKEDILKEIVEEVAQRADHTPDRDPDQEEEIEMTEMIEVEAVLDQDRGFNCVLII